MVADTCERPRIATAEVVVPTGACGCTLRTRACLLRAATAPSTAPHQCQPLPARRCWAVGRCRSLPLVRAQQEERPPAASFCCHLLRRGLVLLARKVGQPGVDSATICYIFSN